MLDIASCKLSRNHNTIDHLCNVECDILWDLVFFLVFF